MLGIAKAGYVNNNNASGIMQTAYAMADMLAYARAIPMVKAALNIEENAENWYFLGTLFDFENVPEQSIKAYRKAYDLTAADTRLHTKAKSRLKKLYFLTGDMEAIEKLSAE